MAVAGLGFSFLSCRKKTIMSAAHIDRKAIPRAEINNTSQLETPLPQRHPGIYTTSFSLQTLDTSSIQPTDVDAFFNPEMKRAEKGFCF
jgi:hypothetical protein